MAAVDANAVLLEEAEAVMRAYLFCGALRDPHDQPMLRQICISGELLRGA